MKPVSVLIVDDSALMRKMVRGMLSESPSIHIAGTAINGLFALKKTEQLKPDIIVLDLEMPEMNGLEFLEKRREKGWDVPVIILSSIARKGARVTMKALSLGACDFITKPDGTPEANRLTASLLETMVISYGHAGRRGQAAIPPDMRHTALNAAVRSPATAHDTEDWPKIRPVRKPAPPEMVVLGISTGGPSALRKVLSGLSPDFAIPVVLVQHMPAGFTTEFAQSLNAICPLEVKEAAEGDLAKPGRVLIAPGGRHITLEKKALACVVHVTDGELVNGHKPSAGVLFNSAAREFGNAAVGIIMTGMGRDGAREIGNIFGAGGITLAQDKSSAIVYGMPRAAVEHNYITREVPLSEMAETMNRLGTGEKTL